jgi:O-antigen/teichoic acid export membrane protein
MSMYIQQAKNILFNNVGARQTIFKNAFWLTISTIANKLLSLGLIIYGASILGAEGYGQSTFALAFVSVLMIFADFGLSPIVTRDFAHEKQKKEELYSIISLKIVLAVGTFILILVSAFFTAPSTDIMSTIVILALFLLVNSFIALGHSFFHARQKMEYEAWFEVLQSVMILAFGLFALFKFSSPARSPWLLLCCFFTSRFFRCE